ncbi:MAG TPA: PA14 domain-containing protein, partial [Opitutaceae bacterium]
KGPLPGAPTDYDRPLLWLPYHADNSSGSQAWVPQNTKWDPRHAGEMLHLSYGKSSIFRVLREEVNGVMQGAAYRLPIDIAASAMRARFHPDNGQLYVIGFRGWQTNGRDAFQRVRYTGVTVPQPVGVSAHKNGVLIRFSAPLDPKTAEDPARYSISKWNYVWGPQYGSGRFSIDQRDAAAEEKALTVPSKGAHNIIDSVAVGAAKLLDDGRSVFLYIPKMTAAMQMELKLDLADPKGAPVRETIYSTVHEMAPEYKIAGIRWEDIKVAASAPVGEPGLAMSFDAEVTDTVKVDQLALTVPAGTAPSVLVGSGRGGNFGVAWQGSLVVPERDDYTFTLEGNGTATLQIDGKPIASGPLPLVAKAPLTLAQGAHAIYASYRGPSEGEARVRLLWSSPQFRDEPVPATAFRHLPGAEQEAWAKVRAGREIFLAAQCVKCHAISSRAVSRDSGTPELSMENSDFKDIGRRLDHGWLERWIAQPEGFCPSVATAQAADVAAYLATLREPGELDGKIPGDAASVGEGAALVEKLHLATWIEPLTKRRQHTDAGLVAFLNAPAAHHVDTKFPDVRLTGDEAAKIAAYIRSKQPAATTSALRGDAAAGKAIVAASCIACHTVPTPAGATAPAAPAILGMDAVARADWAVRGCVAENRGKAPDLRLTPEQKALLLAFRNADRDVGIGSLRRFSAWEYVGTQMNALNCVACHSGTAGEKIPDISLAGEKFEREWIDALIAGKHPAKTRPWLEARMPAFASRAAHLSRGLAARQGAPIASTPTAPASTPEKVALGAKIAGTEGYSCVACHDAGSRKALQVFEGQGPNLRDAAARLRYDYYQRWMHWPQRIAPTTIMPRYTKDRTHAVSDAHGGDDAEKQFEAVWQWIQTLKVTGQ